MAHVYKHLNGENQFIDNLDSLNSEDPFEKEADDLASEALIPEASWKQTDNLLSAVTIEALAKQLNIHPAIIAGRIRFETKNYAKFGKLEMLMVPHNPLVLGSSPSGPTNKYK